jgi:hypothetical protein
VSGPSPCAQIRPELGVYVLGAIAPADRARVSRHLASCPGCREEVAGLAGLPALLRNVPAATVLQLSGERLDDPSDPPQPLLDGLISRVAAVRRRRLWTLAAAAAVLAAAAAAAAGWTPQVLHPAAQPQHAAPTWWAAAAGFNAATGARAAVRYTPQPWGTELEASVSGIPPRTPCQIWATTSSGQRAVGGSWAVTRGDPHAWYPASLPFPVTSLAGFDITTDGKILVAIPLRPGTPPTPSTAAAAPALIP